MKEVLFNLFAGAFIEVGKQGFKELLAQLYEKTENKEKFWLDFNAVLSFLALLAHHVKETKTKVDDALLVPLYAAMKTFQDENRGLIL